MTLLNNTSVTSAYRKPKGWQRNVSDKTARGPRMLCQNDSFIASCAPASFSDFPPNFQTIFTKEKT